MILYVRGDLFQSPAQVLVNTVNTVGVMGKGFSTNRMILPITQIKSWMIIHNIANDRCFLISTIIVIAKKTNARPIIQNIVLFSVPKILAT